MFMAMENIRKQEEQAAFGNDPDLTSGILLAETEGFLMCSQGSLCCCLEEISQGYCLQADSSQYLVSFFFKLFLRVF